MIQRSDPAGGEPTLGRDRSDSLSWRHGRSFDDLVEVSSASFAYPRVGGSDRAEVARALVTAATPSGVFVLSTCLRVEIAVAGDEVTLKKALGDIFGAVAAEPQVRIGEPAVEHLFRVAAGLESPIVGEVEVLTQFRQAVGDLKASRLVDGGFLKVLESAVASGRRARETMETSPHDTMAAVAAQMVGTHPAVAVVGTGTMATAVVAALGALPAPPRVSMVTRRPEQVSSENVEVVPLVDLESVIAEYPALVSATAASEQLMDDEVVAEALRLRTHPLTLVDMAMPPDFAAPDSGLVTYVGIDDLARMVRRRDTTNGVADQVSSAAADAYHSYVHRGRAGPVIAAMLAAGDTVVDETVERFAGRLTDPADREVLRQAAHTVARTILDKPVSAVRSSGDERIVEALASAFEDE